MRLRGFVANAAAGYSSDSAPTSPNLGPHERGSRRRRIAQLAGNVYRAGEKAVAEMRESYNQTTAFDALEGASGDAVAAQRGLGGVPGGFPDVEVVARGDDQMVLFPSYAKRHVRQFGPDGGNEAGREGMSTTEAPILNEEDYWKHEWAKNEDKKAVVDVDVRGWIYTPHRGPITRRNRILIGLARQLSGIPVPTRAGSQSSTATTPPTAGAVNAAATALTGHSLEAAMGGAGGGGSPGNNLSTLHEHHEAQREQEKIAAEAARIERKGHSEKEVANRGGYSEPPAAADADGTYYGGRSFGGSVTGSRTPTSTSVPSSPVLAAARLSASAATDLTDAELAVANANLMARIAPFMSTPLAQLPITVFFYNGDRSQSRTVMTDDSGHFSLRAPLDFVPTHVRVLANEDLSAIQPVRVTEKRGISLISDIDDTIKHSNISAGAREIFRNTFVRELGGLTVDGVREWYGALADAGVSFHYCSNSPWQLFPVLANFFVLAGYPQGSMHLKAYSGMLQGIFEPVAERKKGTLDRIMRDFPERRFLLVGDSGEADLEVYTDLVVANPGRIVAVFIRDVTTPDAAGYFDSAPLSLNTAAAARRRTNMSAASNDGGGGGGGPIVDSPSSRPALPPRIASDPSGGGLGLSRHPAAAAPQQPDTTTTPPPAMGTLIDLSDEPEELTLDQADALDDEIRASSSSSAAAPARRPRPAGNSVSAIDLLRGKGPPPPRPAKPVALRSTPSNLAAGAFSPSAPGGTGLSALGITMTAATPSGSTTPTVAGGSTTTDRPAPPPRSRHPSGGPQTTSPLAQMRNLGDASTPTLAAATPNEDSNDSSSANGRERPPPPPPRRRATPSSLLSLSPRLLASSSHRRSGSNASELAGLEALSLDGGGVGGVGGVGYGGGGGAGPSVSALSAHGSPAHSPQGSPTFGATNRKVELWRRRLRRAQDILEQRGVRLYTWRHGADVSEEAVGIVRAVMERWEREEQQEEERSRRG